MNKSFAYWICTRCELLLSTDQSDSVHISPKTQMLPNWSEPIKTGLLRIDQISK